MRLHTYFRSSAAYRVRIALALKGLDVETVPVHLVRAGGAQNTPDFRRLNPMGAVPVLEEGNAVLTQSLAIIEYLDEAYPAPPLLPMPLLERARVRAIAQTIACDIHPLNNLRVLNYLTQEVGAGETARKAWTRHWITRGLEAVEQLLVNSANTGAFCHGDTPGLADCCLVPQVFNARRFDCPIDHLPTVLRVVETCQHHPAIAAARPEAQPDWEDPTN